MKLTRSLICLPVLAALSLVSCTSGSGWNSYGSATANGPTYLSSKYESQSFGGHGGGYGNGYNIWPMPTENYAEYWADDDDADFVGKSYGRSEKEIRQPRPSVSRAVASGPVTSGK